MTSGEGVRQPLLSGQDLIVAVITKVLAVPRKTDDRCRQSEIARRVAEEIEQEERYEAAGRAALAKATGEGAP